MQVVMPRIVRRRVFLGEDRDDGRRQVVDVLDQCDRLFATHIEWRDGTGEEDGVANR